MLFPGSCRRLDTHLQLQQIPRLLFEGSPKGYFCSIFRNPSKIRENEKHEWGHRGGTTTRKHNHNKQACVHFESTHAISPSTSINTNTHQGLICAALTAHRLGTVSLVVSILCLFPEKNNNPTLRICVNQFITGINKGKKINIQTVQLQPRFH